MTHGLVILGATGNASDVLDLVDALNVHSGGWRVLGFLDDVREPGTRYLGFEVLGPLASASRRAGCLFLNAIGSDRSFQQRPALVARTGLRREQFATLVHPLAAVSPRAQLGAGVCVGPGVCVAGGVSVGDHAWLGPGSIVGHDTVVAAHAVLAPGAVVSGACLVGSACYVGAGALLRQRVRTGDRSLIGMGAVVLHDVPAEAVVVGNPARVLRSAGPSSP